MPARPEVGERDREVRLPEVGAHLDAEELRDALDHVDAAREVAVELRVVGEQADHDERAGDGVVDVAEDVADGLLEHDGDGELLEEAERDAHEAAAHPVGIGRMGCCKLRRERAVLVDRALDELGEVRGEEQVLGEVALSRLLAVVDIDHVARDLEGEERDAQRQHEAQMAGIRHEVAEDGLPVLEVAEHAQADSERADEDEPLAHGVAGLDGLLLRTVGDGLARRLGLALELLEPYRGGPGDRRRADHVDEALPASRDGVEDEARGEQRRPLDAGLHAPEHHVDAPCCREEDQELGGEELQCATPRAL